MEQFSHKDFEELLSLDEENQFCFDCGKRPALWASVNIGIYLCLNCSGVHRGFGVHISYIRSITLDSWSEIQISSMRLGGNRRLRLLLDDYAIDKENKEELYNSKLLDFHRRMSEVNKLDKPDKSELEQVILSNLAKRNTKVDESFLNLKRLDSKISDTTVTSNTLSRSVSNCSFYPLGIEKPVLPTKFRSNKDVMKDNNLQIYAESIKSSNNVVDNIAKKANEGVNYIFRKLFGERKSISYNSDIKIIME